MIKQYDKVRLKTGEVAYIVEILKQDVAYIADIIMANGETQTNQIPYDEISSVFEEIEHPLKTGA